VRADAWATAPGDKTQTIKHAPSSARRKDVTDMSPPGTGSPTKATGVLTNFRTQSVARSTTSELPARDPRP
jgi:hypothetical protein